MMTILAYKDIRVYEAPRADCWSIRLDRAVKDHLDFFHPFKTEDMADDPGIYARFCRFIVDHKAELADWELIQESGRDYHQSGGRSDLQI
jgi:hypothetical protein